MDILDGLFRYSWEQIPFVFLALLIAFTIHEFAHAYLAFKFGDPTAQLLGRVTLNPRVHLDLFGTILIFIAGFGWAKPVPVNRANFSHPRLMGVIVSAAGPISNLIIGFLGLLIHYLLSYFQLYAVMSIGISEAVFLFLQLLIQLNLILFIFNLIPLPPLDGYRIVEDIAPLTWREKLRQYEQWSIFIFLLMVFIPPVSNVTLAPIFSFSGTIFIWMNDLLSAIFG